MRAIVGDAIFATDEQTMESVVLDLLRERGLSLAVAESVTGGMVGARITAVPGASDVFRGAVVSYASEVKFDVLGVPEGPVVSTDAAKAMALGVRERLGADVGIATTGVAGPTEQEGHPPGTVFLGLARGGRRRSAAGAPAGRPAPCPRVCGDQRAEPAAAADLGVVAESRAAIACTRPGREPSLAITCQDD